MLQTFEFRGLLKAAFLIGMLQCATSSHRDHSIAANIKRGMDSSSFNKLSKERKVVYSYLHECVGYFINDKSARLLYASTFPVELNGMVPEELCTLDEADDDDTCETEFVDLVNKFLDYLNDADEDTWLIYHTPRNYFSKLPNAWLSAEALRQKKKEEIRERLREYSGWGGRRLCEHTSDGSDCDVTYPKTDDEHNPLLNRGNRRRLAVPAELKEVMQRFHNKNNKKMEAYQLVEEAAKLGMTLTVMTAGRHIRKWTPAPQMLFDDIEDPLERINAEIDHLKKSIHRNKDDPQRINHIQKIAALMLQRRNALNEVPEPCQKCNDTLLYPCDITWGSHSMHTGFLGGKRCEKDDNGEYFLPCEECNVVTL